MQDYKVMVHKGLGSDKAICGSESADFSSSFFPPSLTRGMTPNTDKGNQIYSV